MSDEKENTTGLSAMVIPMFFGSCTTGDWRTGVSEAGEATVSLPSVLAPMGSWAGSLLMCLVGIVGVWYLASRMIRQRGWLIVLFCLSIDWLLTGLLVWPVREAAVANPLGLWPYLLGALATFLAGMVAGFLVAPAPLRFGFGMVSVDLLVAGLTGLVQPQALSPKLVSRILLAFASAGFGALVGKSVFVAVVEDRSALGRCLAMTALQILIAGVGGAVTVLLLKYNGM